MKYLIGILMILAVIAPTYGFEMIQESSGISFWAEDIQIENGTLVVYLSADELAFLDPAPPGTEYRPL